jgi:hypothetical protein
MKNLLGSLLLIFTSALAAGTNYYSCVGGTGNWTTTFGANCSVNNLPTNLTGSDTIFILAGTTRLYSLQGLSPLNAVLIIEGTLSLGGGNNTWVLNSSARVVVRSGGSISGSGNASVTNNGYILVEEGGNFFVGTGGNADLTISGTGTLILNGTFGGRNLVNNGTITGTGTVNPGTTITGSGTFNGTTGTFTAPLDLTTATANIWNGTIWSRGTPTTNSLCIFQANYNTATHGAIWVANAIIDSGYTVTVNETANSLFYVNEFLENNGTLVFENNTRTGGFSVAGNGNITLVRKFTRTGWHHLGFPTQGDQSVADLVPSGFSIALTGASANLYRWNAATASWALAGSAGLKQQPLNLYVGAVPSSVSLTIPAADLNKTSQEQFFSYFNPGTTPPSPGSSWTVGNPTDGWNLFVNPFQSYLDWDAFVSALPGDFESAIHVWNGSGYENYTVGSTSNSRWVSPNQAFFVRKTTTGSGSFNVPRAAIVQTPGNLSSYFKGNLYSGNMVLQLDYGLGTESLEVIGNTLASYNFDPAWDAHHLSPVSSVPSFYSVTQDSLKVAINQIPEFNETPIYLGLKYDITLEDSITIGAHPQYRAGQRHIWLDDLYLNTTTDLTAGPYRFAHDPLAPEQRFALRFPAPSNLGSESPVDTKAKAWVRGQQVVIQSNPMQPVLTYAVYNMAGQRMAEALPVETVALTQSGMYLVVFTYENGQESAVKVVR